MGADKSEPSPIYCRDWDVSDLQEALDWSKVTAFVTGAGGYFGRRLCGALLRLGAYKVLAFDVREPVPPQGATKEELKRFKSVTGDIRNYNEVAEACKGANAVFHIASYGMSGRESLQKKMIYAVNVQGTEHIIKACVENNIPVLVYTSSFNAVFGGKPIVNGDQSVPHYPEHLHVDMYSRTKTMADKRILKADGIPMANTRALRTCSVRSAGIYGEGEERHLPRIVKLLKAGLVRFTIGRDEDLVEFVYVDNLVKAHLQAAIALTQPYSRAGGKAVYISDWEPMNNFEFFRPLIEGLGHPYPSIKLPVWLMYYIGFLIEMIHILVSPVYNFQPLMTRAEVFKTSVTHYFNPMGSKTILGYKPAVSYQEGMRRVVEWYVARGYKREASKINYTGVLYILLGVAIVLYAVYCGGM
eukprot:Colp12_sorted_trinity150504_noHs@29199